MQAELEALTKALEAPSGPVIAIVGGAKVSTKLDLLGNLVARVDALVIGGGMANTFLPREGVGRRQVALREGPRRDRARDHGQGGARPDARIILPVDAVVADEFKAGAPRRRLRRSTRSRPTA